MKTKAQQKVAWRAFCCPICRCVFRLRQESSSIGAVCPSCLYLLRLPGAQEECHFRDSTKQKRHESHSRAQTLHYQEVNNPETQWSGESGQNKKSYALLVLFLLGFLGVGGISFFLIKRQNTYKKSLIEYTDKANEKSLLGAFEIEREVELPTEGETVALEADEVTAMASQFFPEFFKAKSVDEILNLIRPTKDIRKKLEQYYEGKLFEDDEFVKLDPNNRLYFDGKFAVIPVQTKNHESKWAVFEMFENGLKFDWESWVVWSSMSWDTFKKEKPVEPQEFRIYLGQADYYNFGFSDDEKWKCFAIESGDKEHYIYGYVEQGGLLERQLTKNAVGSKSAGIITVEISYPEDAIASNQVLIHKLLRYGWVGEE